MDSKRVEVLHIADCYAVVVTVSYHLVLYLFPTLQRFLHKYLRREGEGFACQFAQLLLVVAEAAAQSSQRVCGSYDYRIAKLLGCRYGILYILYCGALYCAYVYLVQFLNKEFAVFGIHNCLNGCSQNLHVVFFQDSLLVEFYSAVKRCLASKGKEYSLRSLFAYYLLYKICCNREEVDSVCNTLRCLYGCNVGVYEDGLYALLLHCLQCLRTGIVKLSGLTNLQGAGTKEQYFLYLIFHLLEQF